jgi:single-stranded-DNA-specific exonuclease
MIVSTSWALASCTVHQPWAKPGNCWLESIPPLNLNAWGTVLKALIQFIAFSVKGEVHFFYFPVPCSLPTEKYYIMLQPQWQVPICQQVPDWFIQAVKAYTPESNGRYAAQLLWQRGIQNSEDLIKFIEPDSYQPSSPFVFGQEMKWAVRGIQKAFTSGEKVTIWGDFDADGITSTSVLWEGLGQFFPQHQQLNYYIPNRFTESHGLNCPGIERLAASGTKLIVTCDTGSTNLTEIDYANQLGIDLIITDHHSLPEERPAVISIINPRYFAETHPLYHLSGVAVAYKLVEGLYETFPEIPQQSLEELLDLVAIGLIADLVQLKGDCRYLAQKGIQQLQKQNSPSSATRPGISKLLKFCQRSGDRPTDISFGLGPRINAVSRIHGDGSFGVELLTSRDEKRCNQLALETELANTRRKSLQKEMEGQVKKKLAYLDLSTTYVIVLEDPQWQSGILGLVAGQIAQEYGRPTILLTTANETEIEPKFSSPMARGSARSVNNIDLYQLVASQAHLLHRFGGHPLAAGLSLPIENLPLFREAINQQLRWQHPQISFLHPILEADLVVSVSELGKNLFRELKLLEPCGMGNPVPKLLIQNCWFADIWHRNLEDKRGKKVSYLKTTFNIYDPTVEQGFPGVWWGHYKEELPENTPCDVIVELDFNPYQEQYEIRLIAIRISSTHSQLNNPLNQSDYLVDWRNNPQPIDSESSLILLQECPSTWETIQREYRRAISQEEKLALAYSYPQELQPEAIWKQLIGIAKYLSRTGKIIPQQQLQQKLNLSDCTLKLGLQVLSQLGFNCHHLHQSIQIDYDANCLEDSEQKINQFLQAIEEEQFQRQYFSKIPLVNISYHLLP